MLNLIKGVFAVALGAGGVGATVYGAMKKSSNYWESWNKKITVNEPAILCDENLDKYEGILKISSDGKNNMGLGLTIEFNATQWDKTDRTGTKRSWTRLWGENAKENNDWASWKIDFEDGKIYNLRYKDLDTKGEGRGYTMDQKVGQCDKSKIRLKKSVAKQDDDKGVENKNIRFDINRDTCQIGTDSVTCDIIFASGSNLEWVEEFKPQITYSRATK